MPVTRIYSGIVDAHGIESFNEGSQAMQILCLRASLNRHRHAIAYKVALQEEQAHKIRKALMSKRKNPEKSALKILKAYITCGAPCELGGGGDMAGSLELIPNSRLDPWYSGN
jgi:hypothetical protein